MSNSVIILATVYYVFSPESILDQNPVLVSGRLLKCAFVKEEEKGVKKRLPWLSLFHAPEQSDFKPMECHR